MRSARNGPEAIGGAGQGRTGGTFFSFKDSLNRPCSKLSIRTVLYLLYCWAADLTISQCQYFTSSLISSTRNETFVDWRHFIREILAGVLEDSPPMGGPGEVVQIDESCFR